MKKTVAGILSTATIVGVMAGSITAFADQTIDGRYGETSGDVLVNGIIGEFDNTVEGPDPEDVNQWINVTIPTTALFYTTEESEHKEIVSPTYTITNNSAKGVIATVSNVEDAANMDEVDSLFVNGIQLFTDGEVTVAETEMSSIDSKENTTFNFTGTATPNNAAEEVNPSFKLVLSFAPIIVDGE